MVLRLRWRIWRVCLQPSNSELVAFEPHGRARGNCDKVLIGQTKGGPKCSLQSEKGKFPS
uniref:DNA replication licensing factor MCM3 n=1 Tax=Coccidioides posadasii RMSCC 3488 TaxID=454284 RepID=A0A0J6FNL9_COCPO|nr:DNA replication licensing factor MCM3 [Coccidioides posadasii RMSCC 3488]